MSHTFTSSDGRYVFTYNSDLSGEVTIRRPAATVSAGPPQSLLLELKVDGRALLEFAAAHVRRARISKLENADASELLGIELPKSSVRKS